MAKQHTTLSTIKVVLDFSSGPIAVGRLATKDRRIYFEYDAAFVNRGLAISPFRLPLKTGVQEFDPGLFDGRHRCRRGRIRLQPDGPRRRPRCHGKPFIPGEKRAGLFCDKALRPPSRQQTPAQAYGQRPASCGFQGAVAGLSGSDQGNHDPDPRHTGSAQNVPAGRVQRAFAQPRRSCQEFLIPDG